MPETAVNAYATNSSNAAAGSPTPVAVVNDGTGDRQIVAVGAGDGSTTMAPVDATKGLSTTDATVQGLFQQLLDLIGILKDTQNSLPFARDNTDRLIVNISTGTISAATMAMWSNGSYAAYYATGGPNSVDQRELMELTSLENLNIIRNNRWVIN